MSRLSRSRGRRLRFLAPVALISSAAAAVAAPGPAGPVGQVGLRLTERDGGVWVVEVVSGLPAHAAGLRVGDQLLAVDGVLVNDRAHARPLLARFASAGRISLHVQAPALASSLTATTAPGSAGRAHLGLAVVERRGKWIISEVAPGSPAERARLQVGHELVSFEGTAVGSAERVQRWLDAAQPGATAQLVSRAPNVVLELRSKRVAQAVAAEAESRPRALEERGWLAQVGFAAYGFGAEGRSVASGGALGAVRLRGLVGSFARPDSALTFALDGALEAFGGGGSAAVGGQTRGAATLGGRVELGVRVGYFGPARDGVRRGFGVRVGGVGTVAVVTDDSTSLGGAGAAVFAGLEYASYDESTGALYTVTGCALLPVPQELPSATLGLQFMF